MELLQLKYFCNAAETENLSKTAKKYLVPTSNISQSIKRLEKELGCELFEHRSNRILLNDEGKRFYSNVSEALALLESARMRISDRNERIYGDIRLICMNNRRIVTNAIETFIQEHPQVNFIIHHSFDSEQDFDVLISDICPCEFSKKTLIVDESICIAINKEHPLLGKKAFSVADLAQERFITMTSGTSHKKITINVCADAGFVPNIAIQTDDPFYLRKYIEMGLGIAVVPSNSWRGLFTDKVVLKNVDNTRRKTYAFLPKRKYIKRSVELFLQVLCDEAAECSKE